VSHETITAAPISTEVPHARMGVWWFIASEIALFGGLIMVFVLMRLAHPEWSEQASHTVNAAGILNTMVLLTSSLTVVLANQSVARGRLVDASRFLFLTVGLGLVFMIVKGYEYSHEIHEGFTPVAGLFWSFYYVMTGLHGLHVLGGMIAIFLIAIGVRKGRHPGRVEAVGIYWHLVDIIWIFLFPLLYLAA